MINKQWIKCWGDIFVEETSEISFLFILNLKTLFGVNLYPLTHPILAKTKNQIFFFFFFFLQIHVNSLKNICKEEILKTTPIF